MATSATLIWNSWKSNLHPHRKGTQRIPPAKIITGNIMKMLEASSLQLPKTWIGEVSLKPRQGSASPQSAWDIGVHDHASVLQCHPWQYFHGQYWILLDTIGYYWIPSKVDTVRFLLCFLGRVVDSCSWRHQGFRGKCRSHVPNVGPWPFPWGAPRNSHISQSLGFSNWTRISWSFGFRDAKKSN